VDIGLIIYVTENLPARKLLELYEKEMERRLK
jgi:hypothetical protein